MLQQVIPQGPTRAPESIIDRTQILKPEQFWPNAADCPDWPALRPTEQYLGPRGKAGAEQRLEAVGRGLNRGHGKLRVPMPAEVEAEFARTFRRSGSTWYHLGIRELSALGMMAEGDAGLIVEACHLRGYLRKLEAKATQEVDEAKRRRANEARQTLEDYRATVPAEIEEIKSLAEAAARHRQRLDDEKAFDRSHMLRQHIEGLHNYAIQAAHTLGLSVPDAPQILD